MKNNLVWLLKNAMGFMNVKPEVTHRLNHDLAKTGL